MCRELPREEAQQRLSLEKNYFRGYADFVEAAVEGAKAVVDGGLSSLNPMDGASQQVFVFNGIFFSYAAPNTFDFRDETSQETCATFSVTNTDLRNLRVLAKLDVPQLSLLNTVLVDYKGRRVIAQTMIPGILSSNAHQNSIQYGTLDEGKTINNNYEVCQKAIYLFCINEIFLF